MIEFKNVSKRYAGETDILNAMSFQVQAGELVFLSGPSGAGKSTLLKMIAAIERPTAGTVLVGGQDIGSMKPAALPYLRRKLGLVLQQQRLLLDRSVVANVMLPLLVAENTGRADAEKRARAALEKVGLGNKALAMPQSLSGGEQQRVAIARAIVHQPQIILADEPTANLDRAAAQRVLDTLRAFHKAGVTCLIATHDDAFLGGPERVIRLGQQALQPREPELVQPLQMQAQEQGQLA